jgi:dihydroneopterin aldolase
MITVQLYDLKFHAFHGVYEGEVKTGHDFLVNLSVAYNENKGRFDNINDVLNYVELYEIVSKRMSIASPLLEEVADSIIRKIKHQYSVVKQISLSIYKLGAPVEGFQGKIGITLEKKFDD